MIRGVITDEGYFVEAEVSASPGGRSSPVTFLVDSGASATAIHPSDTPKLGIPATILQRAERLRVHGIGGSSTYRLIHGALTFQNDAAPTPLRYSTTLYIADPTEDNADIPSLLGRDILNYWQTWRIDVDRGVIGFTASRP